MPTIAQAQAKALQGGFFEGLGASRSDFTAPNLRTVEALMALYAEEFQNRFVDNLNRENKVTTGGLADSFTFEAKFLGRGFKVQFIVADYYDYVDKGVQGVGPGNQNSTSPYKFKGAWVSRSHQEAIRKWIKSNRGLVVARDVNKYGRTKQESKAIDPVKKEKSLAYVIARSTKKKGLKQTGVWSDAFNDTFKDFAVQMSQALGVDIVVDLKQMEKNVKLKKK